MTPAAFIPKWTTAFLCLSLLLSHDAKAGANLEDTGQELVKTYGRLTTYCEKGSSTSSNIWGSTSRASFTRCVDFGGRFKEKFSEADELRSWQVRWSDGEKFYVHSGYWQGETLKTRSYSETRIDSLASTAEQREKKFLGFILQSYAGEFDSVAGLTANLGKYAAMDELANAEFKVYERTSRMPPNGDNLTRERLYVSRADGLIRKYEYARRYEQGTVDNEVRVVVLDEVTPSRRLSFGDLTHEVPWLVRNPPTKYLGVYTFIFCGVIFVSGIFFWRKWSRVRGHDALVHLRKKCWRTFRLTALMVTAALAALAALALLFGGGHPPAIILVFVLAYFLSLCFSIVGSFILSSYLTGPQTGTPPERQ